MAKKTIRELDLQGSEVLVRVDFNVPLADEDGAMVISDDTRIVGALPTLKYLVEGGARTVLMSHLGRPKGERRANLSLASVADYLEELLEDVPVRFVDDCIGEEVDAARASLQPGEILLLENVRFYKEETEDDKDFAQQLAGDAAFYVNDAFGTAHRAHASTAGVAAYIDECAMGFLMERELQYLLEELADPERPFIVILGGAKVSDKINVIKALLDRADTILIGGAMAYTFKLALGGSVGNSLVEPDKTELALEILKLAEKKGVNFVLPADTLEANAFKEGAKTKVTKPGGNIHKGWEGVDIGPTAIKEFSAIIKDARTIVWNGPMGVFEIDSFAKGTKAIAKAVAAADAVSIIGGGDSVTAIKKFGLEDQVTFISTGGGASLELLEGRELPGVAALDEA